VSGSYDDKAVRVWEVATRKEIARMIHDYFVEAVTFSADGKYVVSGSRDGTARVWEATTGKEIARITHNGGVFSVAFNPDGKYVASGSEDNIAHVWYWRIEDLIIEACKRLPRNLTRAEWAQYIENKPYRATCTNLPPEPEITTPSPTP
jgi:hypothetical protein